MKMNDSIKKLESISDIIGISERMLLRDCGIEKNAIEILKSAEKARKVHRWMMLKVINNQEKTIQQLFTVFESSWCYIQSSGYIAQVSMREQAKEPLKNFIKTVQSKDEIDFWSEMLKIADEAPYKWELLLKLLAEKHNLEHTWIELTEEEKSLKYFEEIAPRASIFGF